MDGRIAIGCLALFGTLARAPAAQTTSAVPVWNAEGDQMSAGFGSGVSAAGDVNGDGYGDVLVGAYSYTGDQPDEGSASVFHGSKYGLSKVPDWRAEGDQGFANFGGTLSGAGDVNRDGYDDVIVGAQQARRAYLYLGSPAGLAPSASWTAQSSNGSFAWSVASAGDVDGDGFVDVLVSALGATGDVAYEGRVYLYRGSPAGLEASPAWHADGNQMHSAFGAWVDTAGDVNGDGYADVLVGAPRATNGQREEGRVFAYYGSAAGLSTSPDWIGEIDQIGALLGYWVSSAGDVNGDGYDEVVVSANNYNGGHSSEGAAFVYQGSAAGLASTPTWSFESNQTAAIAGAVSHADLNGDGFSDVLVGYYAFDRTQRNEGAAFAYLGSASGLAATPGWIAEGNQKDCMFGFALSGAGDVNGDGLGDVLVGAYDFDHGQSNEGRAFAYLGSSLRRLQ